MLGGGGGINSRELRGKILRGKEPRGKCQRRNMGEGKETHLHVEDS